MLPVEITAMETITNFRLNKQIKQDRKYATHVNYFWIKIRGGDHVRAWKSCRILNQKSANKFNVLAAVCILTADFWDGVL
jgi:hypothetical protein